MKKIGNTLNGGIIVEMSNNEAKEFERLGEAITGHSFSGDFYIDPLENRMGEINFNGIFGTIRAFYLAKYKANELRELANELDHTLEEK